MKHTKRILCIENYYWYYYSCYDYHIYLLIYFVDDVLRKNRGLGMLLASIGGNKDKEASNNGMVPAGKFEAILNSKQAPIPVYNGLLVQVCTYSTSLI